MSPTTLTPGARLGDFEILSTLGEGGMGAVYRARDSKLNRDVAIKVLLPAVANDPDRLARFSREAQVLASLNHPNIAHIHGLEDREGVRALVMELVEGPTLADRIAHGAIPLDEALPIARQIAEALEAAHEQGIIHRDLKPANIKVRPDSTVKLLDFGLAKAMEPTGASSANAINSPTISLHATQAGIILGTAAYMSPEQARGAVVDRRADIWAFGCVLYEMLAGTAAFARESMTDTLAAITRDEPDVAFLTTLPPAIDALLRRCLQKDPRVRLRDIGEARIVLSGQSVAAEPTPSRTAPGKLTRRRRLMPLIAGGVLVAALSGGVAWSLARRGAAASDVPVLAPTLVQVTVDPGLTLEPSVSPTGTLLAYASDRGGAGLHIWVQPLPSGDPVQITRGDQDDRDPNFSPDGSRIAFRSERDGGGIYVVPALGGAERLIAPKGYAPAFAPDGRRIAYITGGRGEEEELWLVDEAGGEPRRLAADIRIVGLGTVWMKDGSTLVVVGRVRESTTTDWWSVDVASGKASAMGAAETFTRAGFASVGQPAAVLNDRIVFSDDADRSHSMWSTALTADGRAVRGEPRRLTGGTRFDSSPSIANGPDGAQLYYASLDLRANLYRLPVVANEGRAHGEPQPITDTATTNAWPSLSGDGSTLAFGSRRGAATGAWLRDMATGREIPAASAVLSMPNRIMLSPDGRTVALSGSDGIALQPVGGGTRQLLKDTGRPLLLWDWPAPSMIIFGNGELLAVNPQTGSTRPLISGGKPGDYYGHGRLSPDGKWISAMQWTNADQARVMVFPFRDTPVPPEEWIGITGGNTVAEEHAWSPDGNLLYIVSEKDGYRCVWAQRLDPQSKHPVGALMPVAHFHRARLQMIATAATPQRIVLGPQSLIFSMDERRGNIWMATVK